MGYALDDIGIIIQYGIDGMICWIGSREFDHGEFTRFCRIRVSGMNYQSWGYVLGIECLC